ncbi:hypothetical protein CLOSTHATH_06596, partial [Hungatella hathewayi DSM 13479]
QAGMAESEFIKTNKCGTRQRVHQGYRERPQEELTILRPFSVFIPR